MTHMPAVLFRDVSYQEGDARILWDVSFEIPHGSYVGIVGPNGGGKTTLLKLILGLLKPSSGLIQVFGEEPASTKARSRIGYVPQRLHGGGKAFPATVEEVVGSREALETMGIADLRTKTLSRLSGGEIQKVYIARALASRPELLIFDEPTTGVDLPSREQFSEFLNRLNREQGMTVIVVSHDIEAMQHGVQSVLCLNGTVLDHCSPECFLREDTFKRLYGENAVQLSHHHHH